MVLLGYRSVGVGAARKSLEAYASMAGSQFRTFMISGKLRWIIAIIISIAKAIISIIINLLNQYALKK
jgi:hypothetical protein